MRSMRGLSLLIFAGALTACSAIGEIPVRVSVDCAILGREHKMAEPAKAWLLAQPDPPPELKAFLDSVGDHNAKVREICKGLPAPAPATGVPTS